MSVDRESRDKLVEVIDQYLREDIKAFEFNDAIFGIRYATTDETIKHVVVEFLFNTYDDFINHPVVATSAGWDLMQRLKLLLMSDAELTCRTRHISTSAQGIAAVSLVYLLCACYVLGFAFMPLLAIPFGLVSRRLAKCRNTIREKHECWDDPAFPFTTASQLVWVGMSTSKFQRQRCPAHVTKRRVRSSTTKLATELMQSLSSLMCSPIDLLTLSFPAPIREARVLVR